MPWVLWATISAGVFSACDEPHVPTGRGPAQDEVNMIGADAGAGDASAPVHRPVPQPKTLCTTVNHVGDSLTAQSTDGLASAYEARGIVATIHAFGGRAIKQKIPSDPATGLDAVAELKAGANASCWVVALGTNDTANVSAGAWYTRAEAIDEMMMAIDPAQRKTVVWINTHTTRTTGHWSNQNMKLFNDALDAALARWENLRVYDWSTVASGGGAPYSDGIHHTQDGYAVRNAAIAEFVSQVAVHNQKRQ